MMLKETNRRSSTLRTYAGDTSLPGGRVDPEDTTVEDTAVSIYNSLIWGDILHALLLATRSL